MVTFPPTRRRLPCTGVTTFPDRCCSPLLLGLSYVLIQCSLSNDLLRSSLLPCADHPFLPDCPLSPRFSSVCCASCACLLCCQDLPFRHMTAPFSDAPPHLDCSPHRDDVTCLVRCFSCSHSFSTMLSVSALVICGLRRASLSLLVMCGSDIGVLCVLFVQVGLVSIFTSFSSNCVCFLPVCLLLLCIKVPMVGHGAPIRCACVSFRWLWQMKRNGDDAVHCQMGRCWSVR